MPEYLSENHLAIADDELIFPSVQNCCAVIFSGITDTLTRRRRIGGYHLTILGSEPEYRLVLNQLRYGFKKSVEEIDQVYLVGNVLRACFLPPTHRKLLEETLGCSNIWFYDNSFGREKRNDSWAVRAWLTFDSDYRVHLSVASGDHDGWTKATQPVVVTSEMMRVHRAQSFYAREKRRKVAAFIRSWVPEDASNMVSGPLKAKARQLGEEWESLQPPVDPVDLPYVLDDVTGLTVPGCHIKKEHGIMSDLRKLPVSVGAVGYGDDAHPGRLLRTIRSIKIASSPLSAHSTAPIKGGTQKKGWVTLTAAAPRSGEVVGLVSSHEDATVPATATIPAEQTSIDFTVKTKSVLVRTIVTLAASHKGTTKTVTLVIDP